MPSEDVAIFWDYENCHVAAHHTGYEIVKKIRHVAHSFGCIKQFKAYLELSDPAAFTKSLALRSELQASGVSLTDCPHNGRKDVADKMMLVDMLAYAIDNPAPSTIILISGDRDFAYAVSILRLRRYRVVIVSLAGVHISLKTQASVFLDWNSDVLGAEIVDERWTAISGAPPLPEDYMPPTPRLQREVPSSVRNFPAFLRRGDRSNEDSDIDIMEHLHYKRSSAQGHKTHLDSHVNRGVADDALKEDRSYQRPETPPSHGPEDSSSSSRTESAPAVLYADDLSSSQTVVSKPSTRSDDLVEASTAEQLGARIPIPEIQSLPRTATVENTPPVPAPSVKSPSTAKKEQNQIPLGANTHDVPTSSPVHQPPVPQKTQIHPVGTTLPDPKWNTTSASSPHAQQSQPKVVPSVFNLLVQRLEYHRLNGFTRPFRSSIAIELVTSDNTLYKRAGAERFGQYVALAEKAGIVELGGREGGAWIALRPDWYNATIG